MVVDTSKADSYLSDPYFLNLIRMDSENTVGAVCDPVLSNIIKMIAKEQTISLRLNVKKLNKNKSAEHIYLLKKNDIPYRTVAIQMKERFNYVKELVSDYSPSVMSGATWEKIIQNSSNQPDLSDYMMDEDGKPLVLGASYNLDLEKAAENEKQFRTLMQILSLDSSRLWKLFQKMKGYYESIKSRNFID